MQLKGDSGKEVVGDEGQIADHQYGDKNATAYNNGKLSTDDGESSNNSNDAIVDAFPDAHVRRVLRKIDIRLIPICGIMYCVSLLDRTNLSNAAIAGCLSLE